MEFDTGDNESGEYKVEAIWDSAIYIKKSESGHLPGLYYLVSWKDYPEEKNTWKPASVVQHLRKLISLFHKDHPDKPITTSPAIDTAPPIARPTITPTVPLKQKRGQLAKSTNKRTKKNWAEFDFYSVFGQIWVTYTFDIFSRTAHDCTWLHMTSSQPSSKLLPFNFQVLCLARLSRPSSLSYKASVFFLELSLGQKVFHRRLSYQYLLTIIGFSPQVSCHWVGKFFTQLHSYLYIRRSSRLRRKIIEMSWSRDL